MATGMRWAAGLLLAWGLGAFGLPSTAAATPTFFEQPDCYTFGTPGQPTCQIHMTDYGGPIMAGTTDIYDIWYGYSINDPSVANMAGFFSGLTGSQYMNIASIYGASTQIDFGGSYFESEYLGRNLTDNNLAQIVRNFTQAGNANGAPAASNAIYFIYTAPNVREEQDVYACAFHSDASGLKFAWVSGFDAPTGDGCGDGTPTQNINSSASHEFFETLTDPLVNEAYSSAPPLAWYDSEARNNQGEIADPCNQQTFSTVLGAAAYTVQSIFVNDARSPSGGFCASGNTFTQGIAAPEPETWLLLALGFGLVGGIGRRSRGGGSFPDGGMLRTSGLL